MNYAYNALFSRWSSSRPAGTEGTENSFGRLDETDDPHVTPIKVG